MLWYPHLVPRPAPKPGALRYTNRFGDVYYLHEGRTKTGKPRYFVAKKVGEGALTVMPEGWSFTESINAVVSVTRGKPDTTVVPAEDLAVVEAEIARHDRLWAYKAAPFRGDIVVYQPMRGEIDAVFSEFSRYVWAGREGTPAYKQRLAEARAKIMARQQFDPVFKFSPVAAVAGAYFASRMSYRGKGGWLCLRPGPLARLVKQYIPLLGTDDLFGHF